MLESLHDFWDVSRGCKNIGKLLKSEQPILFDIFSLYKINSIVLWQKDYVELASKEGQRKSLKTKTDIVVNTHEIKCPIFSFEKCPQQGADTYVNNKISVHLMS